ALERRIVELGARAETMAQDRVREDRLAIDAAEAIARLEQDEKDLVARIADAEGRRGSIEARAAEANETVRAGEVSLAQALAAEAAQQADVRVAEAGLAAARQRLYRAAAELQRIGSEIAALGDAAEHEARRDQARNVREAAEAAIAQTTALLAEAEARRDKAATAREQAEARGSSARAALAALIAEAKALERANAADAGGGERVLAQMSTDPGYEHALAAALGDDLEAGLGQGARRWLGGERLDHDPALPAGAEPLASRVRAPAALARRLAQIGVVDVDDGTLPLAVGQRLVTRDGKLRRWDGFVAEAGGVAAAERLIRLNRLAELQRVTPAAQKEVESAETALAAANAEATTARAGIDKARATLAEM